MLNSNYEEEVLKILRTLDDNKKQEVLEIVKGFSKRPKTVSGKEFVEKTQHIRISDDDATEMMQAIESAFNTIEDIEVNLDE